MSVVQAFNQCGLRGLSSLPVNICCLLCVSNAPAWKSSIGTPESGQEGGLAKKASRYAALRGTHPPAVLGIRTPGLFASRRATCVEFVRPPGAGEGTPPPEGKPRGCVLCMSLHVQRPSEAMRLSRLMVCLIHRCTRSQPILTTFNFAILSRESRSRGRDLDRRPHQHRDIVRSFKPRGSRRTLRANKFPELAATIRQTESAQSELHHISKGI